MFIGLYQFDINGKTISLAEMGIFDFPFVWHLSTYMVSFLKFLIAIVLVSLTASEYSNRTLKQNLIDGLSKKELILSKFYLVIALSVIVTLIVAIISLILGLIYSDFNEVSIITRDLEYLGAFFLSHLTFFSMCLFAGILVKRSAFALALIGIWAIFEGVLRGATELINAYYKVDIWSWLGEILPISAIASLIVEPFSKISAVKNGIEMIQTSEFTKDYSVPLLSVAVCLIWTAIFIYSSYALLKRRDL
jgi:ABC-type transport system involved in multi-copper enzyme maturation permease subunit